jgi:hypothetical protein
LLVRWLAILAQKQTNKTKMRRGGSAAAGSIFFESFPFDVIAGLDPLKKQSIGDGCMAGHNQYSHPMSGKTERKKERGPNQSLVHRNLGTF